MTARVFDGEKFAKKREQILAERVKELGFNQHQRLREVSSLKTGSQVGREMSPGLRSSDRGAGFTPKLVSVVFAEDAASQIYTRLKGKAAERVGIVFERVDFSVKDEVDKIAAAIRQASERRDVQGVMVQKPATVRWNELITNYQLLPRLRSGQAITDFGEWWGRLTEAIDPKKDVDCLNPVNLSKVYDGTWTILPATVKAIVTILEHRAKSIEHRAGNKTASDMVQEKNAVVIGRSEIVGRPLAAVLKQFGAKVDLCSADDPELKSKTVKADILVSATGRPSLIKADMVKRGAVVIDVGEPKADVDFEGVKQVAAFITPVPKGVGPVTVVSLLENLVEVAQEERLSSQRG